MVEARSMDRPEVPLIGLENLGLTLGQRVRPRQGLFNQSVAVSLPGHRVFQGINGSLQRGDRWAVLGPAGAGKTSFLRLLNRLLDPTQGRLHWRGQPYETVPVAQLRQYVVLIPPEPKLLGMTVGQALEYPLKLRDWSPRQITDRVQAWIDRMQIPMDWLDRTEQQLSGGQRQWVSLTRGLLIEAPVLLVDEPIAALDLQRAEQLRRILKDQAEQHQCTIVVASHQVDWVQPLCETVLSLDNGQGTILRSPIDWLALEQHLLQARQKDAEEWDESI